MAPQKILTFKGPPAYAATAVYWIGVNKIPPKFDTLWLLYRTFGSLTAHCVMTLQVFLAEKG